MMTEKKIVLEELEAAREVEERPFSSPTPVVGPLLAGLRTLWNNVATKWYVRPIVQQQNEVNRLVVGQFREVQREFEEIMVRLGGVDGRLIAQDREHSDLVHDLGEVTAQLVQMNRLLRSLDERLARLEQEGSTRRHGGHGEEGGNQEGDKETRRQGDKETTGTLEVELLVGEEGGRGGGRE